MAKIKYKDSEGNIKTLNNIKINYAKSEEEWQPEPDWWDIDKILEEDTEDYPAKMIMLIPDNIDTHVLPLCNADKTKMSDGTIYMRPTSGTITHTWDTSKDKDCSLGYKTRYIIYYYNSTTINIYSSMSNNKIYPLYIIHKNMNFTLENGRSLYENNQLLECIKMINSSRLDNNIKFAPNLFSLKKIDKFNFPNINSVRGMFVGIKKLPYEYVNNFFDEIDWSKVTDCTSCFQDNLNIERIYNNFNTRNIENFETIFLSSNIKIIDNLDFFNATNVSRAFSGANSLITINNISNIKISGLDFKDCTLLNHDTLIRILNALYDYSDGDTHTITLGATNLAKLTSEELAIGQNKNWTIS